MSYGYSTKLEGIYPPHEFKAPAPLRPQQLVPPQFEKGGPDKIRSFLNQDDVITLRQTEKSGRDHYPRKTMVVAQLELIVEWFHKADKTLKKDVRLNELAGRVFFLYSNFRTPVQRKVINETMVRWLTNRTEFEHLPVLDLSDVNKLRLIYALVNARNERVRDGLPDPFSDPLRQELESVTRRMLLESTQTRDLPWDLSLGLDGKWIHQEFLSVMLPRSPTYPSYRLAYVQQHPNHPGLEEIAEIKKNIRFQTNWRYWSNPARTLEEWTRADNRMFAQQVAHFIGKRMFSFDAFDHVQ